MLALLEQLLPRLRFAAEALDASSGIFNHRLKLDVSVFPKLNEARLVFDCLIDASHPLVYLAPSEVGYRKVDRL